MTTTLAQPNTQVVQDDDNHHGFGGPAWAASAANSRQLGLGQLFLAKGQGDSEARLHARLDENRAETLRMAHEAAERSLTSEIRMAAVVREEGDKTRSLIRDQEIDRLRAEVAFLRRQPG